MWPLITSLARIVGTASAGYWLNDFASWLNTTLGLGPKTMNATQSKFAWWYVLIVLAILGGIVMTVIYFLNMLAPSPRRRKRR